MRKLVIAVFMLLLSSPAHADEVGWFRIDTDSLSTQFWVGANHDVGDLTIASDVYLVGSVGELDVGINYTAGGLSLTPMVGMAFDFATTNAVSLVAPQLFAAYDNAEIYVEWWSQMFWNSQFDATAQDVLYNRAFALYKLGNVLAVGPQAEASYSVRKGERGVTSLPLGGRINLSYGKHNTLGLFLGFETEAPDGADGIAGRFTLLRTW